VLSTAAGCPDKRWCAPSTRLRGRAVGRRFFHLGVLLTDTPFRTNEFCSKQSQSVNWGAESCVKRKSTSPCLSAIPVFDRIAGLSNRYLTLKGEHVYANDFEVRMRAFIYLAKD